MRLIIKTLAYVKSRCQKETIYPDENADIFGIISQNIRIILLLSFFLSKDSCDPETPRHREQSIDAISLTIPTKEVSGWWMFANGRPPSLFLSIKLVVNRHRNTRKPCKCSSGTVTRRSRRRSDVRRSPVKHASKTGVACSTQHAVVTADDPRARGGGERLTPREGDPRYFSSGITEIGTSRGARGRNKAIRNIAHCPRYVRGSTGVFTARRCHRREFTSPHDSFGSRSNGSR